MKHLSRFLPLGILLAIVGTIAVVGQQQNSNAIDSADITTPAAPASGHTRTYTKGGTLCAESPAAAETCTGTGGGGAGLTVYSGLAGISLTGATVYFSIGGGSLASATEASVQTVQGSAGTIGPGFGANLSAALGTTIAVNNVVVLTWRKNGSGQSVTCTVTNPATTCTDLTHSFTWASGDNLDIQAVFTGTIAVAPIWVMNAAVSSGAGGGGSGSFVLVEEHTAASSAELDFTTCISSTYDNYQVQMLNVVPASNAVDLVFQVSTNGGSSYDTTAGHYAWALWVWIFNAQAPEGSISDSAIGLTAGGQVTNTASQGGVSGQLQIFNPLSGTAWTRINGQNGYFDTTSRDLGETFTGSYAQTTPVNAFRILATSGNLASGTVRCYGLSH